MAANSIYFPFINPVKFYEADAVNLEKYQTAHFDDHLFSNRILPWQSQEGYEQIWQDTDIIKLQFESTFDPIIVSLIDENLNTVIQLPALVGLPNKFLANTFSFEIAMSLAGIQTGCYQLKVTAGSGLTQKIFISGSQFISSEPIFNSLCLLLLITHKKSRHKMKT